MFFRMEFALPAEEDDVEDDLSMASSMLCRTSAMVSLELLVCESEAVAEAEFASVGGGGGGPWCCNFSCIPARID